MNVKLNDNVVVIAGKDKGKTGRVVNTDPKAGRVTVQGVNLQKKHMKARKANDVSKIVEREGFIVSMTGRGSFVAGKDLEFVREEHLRQIEELMGRIVELASACDIGMDELSEMLRLSFEGD